MAVKFKRNDEAPGGRSHVYWQMPRVRQRMVVLYGGISFVALLLIAHAALTRANSANPREVIQAPAVVVAKSSEGLLADRTAYRVELDVAVDAATAMPAFVYTDEESWHALEPGDRVTVNYQIQPPNNAIEIVSMALPEP